MISFPVLTIAESQIQRILTKQQIAWNVGDSASWGSAFTADADFITILGQVLHGREAITQLHAIMFRGQFKGSHAIVTMRQFRQITPDVVMVEALHEVTDYKSLPAGILAGGDGILKMRIKYVLVKRDDNWQIIAAQNTAIMPAPSPPVAH